MRQWSFLNHLQALFFSTSTLSYSKIFAFIGYGVVYFKTEFIAQAEHIDPETKRFTFWVNSSFV